ncbi:MAG TPA: site-specific DNA-methyltransferase [Candidatus Binatia bacterium]|jgi:site-specific DNA-methyltransferase (adenine-specific)|nr:site-specific DNA-methyltransferase [Candidatus Binatia bacterium]
MHRNLAAFLTGPGPQTLLLKGDAGTLLPTFPTACIDAVVTSPPYWRARRYDGTSSLGTESRADEYIVHLVDILDRLARVLRPTGSLWLNLGDTYTAKNLAGVPWRTAIALQARGWILRNAVVWDKVKGNPCNARDKLRDTYELLFHLVRGPRYWYDVDATRRPPAAPTRRGGRLVTPTGVSGVRYERQINASAALRPAERRAAMAALRRALAQVAAGELADFRMVIRGCQRTTHSDTRAVSGRAQELARRGFYVLPYHPRGSKAGDVWRIVPEDAWRRDTHYAVFPTALCQLPIRATCPPGGIVLDPFAGTGTTLLAATELGRRAIGIDTSATYLTAARARLRAAGG